MKLDNKVILITGASSGIGHAIVEKLKDRNCKFILLSRRIELLQKLLIDTGVSGEAYECDVTDSIRVKETIEAGYKKYGRIDVAVLNSGISYRTNPKEFDPVKGREIMNVNFYGVVNCLEVLLPLLKKQDKSIIAGVSSIADLRGYPRSGFYSASKAALSILLESLRVELLGTGIRVITVRPGFVRTPMTDKNEFSMPLLMEPQKAAEYIINGVEKEKRIIQFPLPIVLSAKLIRLLPGSLFEWLAANHLSGFKKLLMKK